MVERLLVRAFVALALGIALAAFLGVPVPLGEDGNPDLPATAFGQVGLYRLEIALLVFYGCLLLATPAFSGLIRGRLPTEISTRGARFADETDQTAELATTAVETLDLRIREIDEGLTEARAEIDHLKQVRSDNT
jgi:hypothetical protein